MFGHTMESDHRRDDGCSVQVPRTAEERLRLLHRGRQLLDARLQNLQGRRAVGKSSDRSPGSQPETAEKDLWVLRDELKVHLESAALRHEADSKLIENLEGEVSRLRKQLHVLREEKEVHTPFRSVPTPPSSSTIGGGEEAHVHRPVSDEVLVAQLQHEIQAWKDAAHAKDAAFHEQEGKTNELEREALVLCQTIAELRSQAQEREDQLATSLALIDELEAEIATIDPSGSLAVINLPNTTTTTTSNSTAKARQGSTRGDERMSAAGVDAADSVLRTHDGDGRAPLNDANGTLIYDLEEQLHQLSREKLSLEREVEGQRDIITNLQEQWNRLVHDVQARERYLTDEVHSLRLQLDESKRQCVALQSTTGLHQEDHHTSMSRSASNMSTASREQQDPAASPDYVHKSKLEEQRQTLYAEFNKHIAQYQEVNNKYWADMVSQHQAQLEEKDKEIRALQMQQQHQQVEAAAERTVDASTAQVGEPHSGGILGMERDVEQQLAVLRQEVTALTSQLEASHAAFDAYRRDAEAKLRDQSAALDAAQLRAADELAVYRSSCEALEVERDAFQARVTHLEAELTAASAQSQRIFTNNDVRSGDNDEEQENETKQLQSKVAELEATCDALRVELEAVRKAAQQEHTELHQARKTLEDLSDREQELEEQVSSGQSQLEATFQLVETLRGQVYEATRRTASAEEQRLSAESELQAARNTVLEMERALSDIRRAKDLAVERSGALLQSDEALRVELISLRETNAGLEEELSTQSAELVEQQRTLTELRQQHSALTRAHEDATRALSESRLAVATLEEEMAAQSARAEEDRRRLQQSLLSTSSSAIVTHEIDATRLDESHRRLELELHEATSRSRALELLLTRLVQAHRLEKSHWETTLAHERQSAANAESTLSKKAEGGKQQLSKALAALDLTTTEAEHLRQQTVRLEGELGEQIRQLQQLRQQHDSDSVARQRGDEGRLSRAQADLNAAREAANVANAEVAKYRSVVDTLEDELRQRAHEIGVAKQEADTIRSSWEDLQRSATQAERDLSDLRRERVVLTNRNSDLTTTLEELRHDGRIRAAKFQSELDAAAAEHQAYRREREMEIHALQLEVTTLKEEVAMLKLAANHPALPGLVTFPSSEASASAATVVDQRQVSQLQQQIAEQSRQSQRLLAQLQAAQQEIAEKSNIIRDQDQSLASLGEHGDGHHQLTALADRTEELEAKCRKLQRERDSALVERDALQVEHGNQTRRMEHKDQALKRMEAECKATKTQLQSLKAENTAKLKQHSDLRQEIADLQSQCSALVELQEQEAGLREEAEYQLSVLRGASVLVEEKMLDSASLTAAFLHSTAEEWSVALSGFVTSNQKILRRCDDIEALAQQAVTEGLQQNQDLRRECRALSQRLRIAEDSAAASEQQLRDAQAEVERLQAQEQSHLSDFQKERNQLRERQANVQKELSTANANLSALAAKAQRQEEELQLATATHDEERSAFETDRRRHEELVNSLRQTVKEKSETMQRLQRESDDALHRVSTELFDRKRELSDALRTNASLKAQLDDAIPRLEASETELTDAKSQLSDAKRSLATLQRQRDTELASAAHREQSLLAELAESTNQAAAAKTQLQSAQHQLAAISSAHAAASAEVAEYREQLASLQEAHQQLQQRYDEDTLAHRTALQHAEQRAAALQRSARVAEAAAADATSRLAALEEAFRASEDEKAAVTRDKQMLHLDLSELQQSSRRRVAQAEDRLASATKELELLQEHLRKLQQENAALQEDKKNMLDQMDQSERLLREGNVHHHNIARELQSLKATSTEEREGLTAELNQTKAELLTCRRIAASSEARARDAERTCQSLIDEKQQWTAEFERVKDKLVHDLQAAMQEKHEASRKLTEAQRAMVVLESEAEVQRRDAAEQRASLEVVQRELNEYRASLHSSSDRARAAVSEKEEIAGQIATLKDELRKQRLTSERRIKELTEELAEKSGELESLVARVANGAQSHRASELTLQQQVTDLTVMNHQLKAEFSANAAAVQIAQSSVEAERANAQKLQTELLGAKDKIGALERELRSRQSTVAASQDQHEQQVAQLHAELEQLRQHCAEDKRTALLSLERVIQADRQALADVRQARERALRACDQAQHDKQQAEQELEEVTAQLRACKRDADEAAQELLTLYGVADQVARELGLLDEFSILGTSFYQQRAAGMRTPTAGAPHSVGGAIHDLSAAARSQRSASFAALMDKVISRFSAVRRGADGVAAERQQLHDVQEELEVHRRASEQAGDALQKVQVALRHLSDRVEWERQHGGSGARRSGSRSGDEGGGGSSATTSRGDFSQPLRLGQLQTPRETTAQSNSRTQRSVLSKLIQQSVLLERCLKASVETQEALQPHITLCDHQLVAVERALARNQSPNRNTFASSSPSLALGGGGASSGSAATSASGGEALVGNGALDAAQNQRIIVSAGLSVIATRVAQQSRLLLSVVQQLQRWEVLTQSLSLDELLAPSTAQQLRGAPPADASLLPPAIPLITNARELALVFSQAEDFAKLSFIAIVSTAPVVGPTSSSAAGSAPTATSGRSGSGLGHLDGGAPAGGGGHSSNTPGGAAFGDRRRRFVDPSAPPRFGGDGGEAPLSAAEDASAGEAPSSDTDAGAGEDAITKTRAFQKLRKENKRLYTLVRNLTEKLRVAASTAHVSGSRGQLASSSTTSPPVPPLPLPIEGTTRQGTRSGLASTGGVAARGAVHDVSPIRRDDGGSGDEMMDDEYFTTNNSSPVPIAQSIPVSLAAASGASPVDASPDDDVRWVPTGSS